MDSKSIEKGRRFNAGYEVVTGCSSGIGPDHSTVSIVGFDENLRYSRLFEAIPDVVHDLSLGFSEVE